MSLARQIIKIEAEMGFRDVEREPMRFFLLGTDGNVYSPTDLQQYIYPFGSVMHKDAWTTDEEMVDYIKACSKIYYKDGRVETGDLHEDSTGVNVK